MARNPKASAAPAPPLHRLRAGARIGAVVSSFHGELTSRMLDSARRELKAAGLADDDLLVLHVAGSFELPLVARRLAIRDDVDAVLCLGLVLKGETPHDVYISHAVSRGVLQISLETDKPVLFGVLTCHTLEQAEARAGEPHDKGAEVARAALATLAALEASKSVGLRKTLVGFSPGASA